jgi:hypothetical protein
VKRLLALTGSVALAFAVATVPASASAGESDNRPCVTRGEYRQVTNGMTKDRVHSIFDTSGKQLYINRGQVTNEGREYTVCGHPRRGGSYVQVQYNNYEAGGGPLKVSRKQMHVS